MRRFAPPLLVLLLGISACAPELDGPAAPIAVEQFQSASALDATASRQAVMDFVVAYAASPTEGAAALANLVAGPKLASWVRWLDVQHREFPGAIDAVADIRDVEFVGSLEADQATGAQVGLSASVTFRFVPDGNDPFERSRILDGPVTLVRTEEEFLVFDLLRDGVPMSDGIQVFEDESRSDGPVEIVLDSVFMFPPNWQFNVVVRNLGIEPIQFDAETAGLHVEREGQVERIEGVLTSSLETIVPGQEVEGILAYPLQDSADGRVLTLVYGSGRDVLRFEFPLGGLIDVVPPPPPASGVTATGPTGPTG